MFKDVLCVHCMFSCCPQDKVVLMKEVYVVGCCCNVSIAVLTSVSVCVAASGGVEAYDSDDTGCKSPM